MLAAISTVMHVATPSILILVLSEHAQYFKLCQLPCFMKGILVLLQPTQAAIMIR